MLLALDPSSVELTLEQRMFAERQDAFPGQRAHHDHRSVFMYREDAFGAWRWLVDPGGHIVESERFAGRR